MKRLPHLHRLIACAFLIASIACQQSPNTNAPETDNAPAAKSAPMFAERTTGTRGGTLRYRLTSPPRTFNYFLISDEASLLAAFYLTGGRLAEYDHDKQTYVPSIAESWRTTDNLTYELTLRDDVKFSDGQPLTAADVEFTLRALYDKRTGAGAYRDALLVEGRELIVNVIDGRRINLTFPETVASPESYFASLCVMPRHVLEPALAAGTLKDAYGVTTAPAKIVTAGAFAVEAVTPGEQFTFKRNPHYWKRDADGTQLPYLDRLIVKVVADQNAAFAELKENKLDMIDRVRPSDYAALIMEQDANRNKTNSVRVYDLGAGLNTDFLWFNLHDGNNESGTPIVEPHKFAWFADARFRRALAHAVDREGIASATLQGLATPLYGFVSPGNRRWIAGDMPPIEYDLEMAKAGLREAGYVLNQEQGNAPVLMDARSVPVEFTVIVPVENQARVQMATVLQEDFAKLGIKLTIAPIEFGQLEERWRKTFAYDAVLLGNSTSEPDPSSYTGFVLSSGAVHQWNPSQKSPATEWERRADKLMESQAREQNTERRIALFHEIQALYREQMPVIPIVARHITTAANTRIGNYRPAISPPFSLWNAEELFVRK